MEAEEVAKAARLACRAVSSSRARIARRRCLWEADSIEALQGYLDSATEGVAENASFEVDTARHGAARGSGSRRIGSDLEPL